jgi:hypothetical protein
MPTIKFLRFKDLLPGDVVGFEGVNRKISDRDNKGVDAPYFRFKNHKGSRLGNWYSYRLLTDPVPLKKIDEGADGTALEQIGDLDPDRAADPMGIDDGLFGPDPEPTEMKPKKAGKRAGRYGRTG